MKKIIQKGIVIIGLGIMPSIGFSQYFLVLPLPYPIDYLEKAPLEEQEEKAVQEEEEEIEEAPPTEFRRLVPADFYKQEALGYEPGKTFQVPPGLEPQVEFWKRIYHQYSVDEYVLHDAEYMFVYRVVNIGDINRRQVSYRAGRRLIHQRLNAHKLQIRQLLRSLHHKMSVGNSLSSEESQMAKLFEGVSDPLKFLKATYRDRIRSQLGQRERFHQGIVWSGRYLDKMEEIFRQEKIPMEITRLPFVESSFNLKARSKVGASGIWQFMRSTGRQFLKVNPVVDERNDPIEATRAATRLLKQNYQSLQSWPLAITAYNHGPGGMSRAVRKVGSTQLVDIIRHYRSRTFGFASKNFYASFLAALQVETEYEKYLGKVEPEAPLQYDEVEMKDYISLDTLSKYTGVSNSVLRRYNPALTHLVFRGRKLLPKGYRIKLPTGTEESFLASYSKIPNRLTQENQRQSITHKVRRGDTLYYLARKYRTTVNAIRSTNNIGRVIYSGQLLVIPK